MTTQDFPPVRAGALILNVGAGTEIGRRYQANFDVLHVGEAPAAPLVAVVADGMGGGEGSRIAGRTAVDTFVERVGKAHQIDAIVLREAVAEVQRRVRAAGAQVADLTGCTLTALVVKQAEAWIVQLGDSRAYRWREGLLELLTVDHTMAWLGAVNGWYTADSQEAAAARYHLLRYVGHPSEPEPDVLNLQLRPGDVLCLCTDGLAEQVPYRRLAQILERQQTQEADPRGAVGVLLGDSLSAGGNDNATVIVVRVAGPPQH
jgi:serine/threonine protein phosphatase PrpC